jgi:hypothetical protein
MVRRVPWDQLDEDDESVTLDGAPFTGVAVEAVAGHLVSEVEFAEGVQSGTSREWYDDGVLKCQTEERWGTRHGEHKVWRSDGTLAIQATYEYGILVEQRNFDDAGKEVTRFLLNESAPLYATLVTLRKGRHFT